MLLYIKKLILINIYQNIYNRKMEEVYIVEYITRAHSSGYENRTIRIFRDVINASEYLVKLFNEYCLDDDPEDLYIDENMEENAPKPTIELANKIFSPKAIDKFIKNNRGGTIYGPYSEFCVLVPNEILVYKKIIE